MRAQDEHIPPLDWLLEPDPANPDVRYFALRDLLGRPADAPDVVAAQAEVMRTGPVPAILAAQAPEGYWVHPGPGYTISRSAASRANGSRCGRCASFSAWGWKRRRSSSPRPRRAGK